MLNIPVPQEAASIPHAMALRSLGRERKTNLNTVDSLKLLSEQLNPHRRIVHAGDMAYQAGERFSNLYVLSSGFFKIVNLAVDGREHVVSLKFRGDWLGFDGIASGGYSCDAVAMDTGEVWAIPYQALLQACVTMPELLQMLHTAMSRQILHERDSLMSVCTLPADARVADFLRCWAETLAERGMRTDEITLHMTRAEIGNCLGMTLESVSRALSRLERDKIIGFRANGRRAILIPDVGELSAFVQRCLTPSSVVLQ